MSQTLADALRHATAILEQSGLDSARIDAELLLAFVLERDRTWLRTWPETPLSTAQQQHFDTLLQRRRQGEPVAYILGQRAFWSLDLKVTPATLIPRPETELLVEEALKRIPQTAEWTIPDLGTGSGAIALAIARERPRCTLIATDRSAAALQIARQNARDHDIDNVRFLAGDWLRPFAPGFQTGMILCNPPYVRQDDPHLERGDLRFEPRSALAAGAEGLDDLQRIIADAPTHLKPGGWLLLEHGYHQQAAVERLLAQQGYRPLHCLPDLAGQPRLSLAQWPGGR